MEGRNLIDHISKYVNGALGFFFSFVCMEFWLCDLGLELLLVSMLWPSWLLFMEMLIRVGDFRVRIHEMVIRGSDCWVMGVDA